MQVKITWYHWLFLMFSILTEVVGTLIMKISHEWEFSFASEVGLVIMWICLGISIFFFAKVITALPVGVAYALWEAIGLILIVVFSLLFLNEMLTIQKSLGLLCVLLGGILVRYGTDFND